MIPALMIGVAEYLDAQAVAAWKPTGGYTEDDIAIVLRSFPTAPVRVISLAGYGVTDSPNLPTDVVGLQVRTRGTPNDLSVVDAIAESVFDVLHGATHLDLNGVHVNDCYRQSWAPLGTDKTGRPERSDNYRLTIARPSPHRSP